jgi:hypothetical protein
MNLYAEEKTALLSSPFAVALRPSQAGELYTDFTI